VSSVKQSYERQTKALHDAGIPEDRIFEDKMSGKYASRPEFGSSPVEWCNRFVILQGCGG